MSVRKAKRTISSREFSGWVCYLSEQIFQPQRADYYFAQLIAEVVKGRAKHPERVKADRYVNLLKKKEQPPKLAPEQKLERSKLAWYLGLGIDIEQTDLVQQ